MKGLIFFVLMACSPFPQNTPCYMLIWEGFIGNFYRIDEKMKIIRYDTVMGYPGIRYALSYAMVCRDYFYLDHSMAGKIMALAGFANKNDINEFEEIDYILNLDDILNYRKFNRESYFKLLNSNVFKKGIDSQVFRNFVYKIQDKIFNKFYDFARKNLDMRLPLLIGEDAA